ncbi:MAG: hypothetical protein DMF89_02640 [Acidobacteria bacterium]|nr:MAG: hypothetical protein DMF90_12635 [Acidobacteriota bacterium]PYR52372.1 MAG: hypothetical protein DMF89_02640 [Acidobacteriota bacterium]
MNLTAYTGPYTEGFDPGHWTRLCEAARGSPNVILSLVNELDQRANEMDPSKFSRCPGVLSSRGSNGSQAPTVTPPWDWGEYHINSAPDWPSKVGHASMELAVAHNVPVHATENTRFPDNDSSLEHAYDAARGSALLNAAATFHSVHGKSAQLFEGVELEAAKAWVAGAKSISLSCQDEVYRRRIDLVHARVPARQHLSLPRPNSPVGGLLHQHLKPTICMSVAQSHRREIDADHSVAPRG